MISPPSKITFKGLFCANSQHIIPVSPSQFHVIAPVVNPCATHCVKDVNSYVTSIHVFFSKSNNLSGFNMLRDISAGCLRLISFALRHDSLFPLVLLPYTYVFNKVVLLKHLGEALSSLQFIIAQLCTDCIQNCFTCICSHLRREQVVRVRPNDKDAKLKYQECNKIVKQKAFERAIASDELKRSVVDSLDIENMSKSGGISPTWSLF